MLLLCLLKQAMKSNVCPPVLVHTHDVHIWTFHASTVTLSSVCSTMATLLFLGQVGVGEDHADAFVHIGGDLGDEFERLQILRHLGRRRCSDDHG